ncbi:hypothetical protein ZEAMMB73_Zm00001d043429 [Zea mays]|uniref:Uncharacterized protein n=1 Tax=Zea mays TaxID=4577 RepID=A0A1D6NBQ2_MAIZE|nr:hypothetical protein ZEAMMB73_Zm00001d043429 [Zea mays]
MAAVARSFLRSSGSSSLRSAAARAASRAGPVPLPRRIPSSGPRRVPGVPDAHAQRHGFGAHDVATRCPGLQGIGLAIRRWNVADYYPVTSDLQMDDLSLLETCSDGIWSGLCNTS